MTHNVRSKNENMESAASVLFGKTRQAVLAVLFQVVDERVHLRELSRRTGIGPGPLQHELSRLVAADLVSRTKDGNRVLYQANTRHPVFHELRGLVLKTCGIPEQLRTALAPLSERISLALVYGSVAKGTSHAGSDVDLLVVGSLKLEELLAKLEPTERLLGREVSVRLFKESEFNKRRAAGDRFLRSVLAGPTLAVIGSADDLG
ncbi:MAG: nucleotidyltransferase domain-containing protein [Myxococcales bacterium]|jgi:predicted nucleotidyltransferase/DNA-binding HxlR family transcriptional regulator